MSVIIRLHALGWACGCKSTTDSVCIIESFISLVLAHFRDSNLLFHLKLTIMNKNYAFVPAYHEWHLIDKNEPDKVLLSWIDPVDDLYDDYNKETGEYEDEPHLMTDYDEIWAVCNHFVEATRITLFEEEFEDPHGNTKEMVYEWPEDCILIPILAHALYDYYVA